ncbi:MAG: hypothetical protein JSW58_14015 [Candidatus Latescibacterota bacterium]|nr:MAG: hypothetical protein JSW58_14015 [Candidatus Latescibacterota bacterium]
MNLPDYNFLPAPLWLVTILHVVTLTLHFVAMNFLFGGLIVLVFGKMANKWDDPTVSKFIRLFPSAVAATVTLGVAPLLFVQLVYYRQVYAATIVSGWFWLLLVGAVMIGYYFLYASAFSINGSRGRVPSFLGLAFLMLLYVSFVFSTVFSMGERPDVYQALYAANQSGWVINSDVGSWLFRWLHMILGAVTVGGFFVGLLGKGNEPVYNLGKKFFLWGMMTTMILGLVYLFTLGDYLLPLMRSVAIWLVVAAIVLSLAALHFFFRRKFVASALLLFLSMVGMVVVRHTLRLIFLEGKFDPGTIPIVPQWSVFIMFLVFFVIAIGLVWYMLKLFLVEKPA